MYHPARRLIPRTRLHPLLWLLTLELLQLCLAAPQQRTAIAQQGYNCTKICNSKNMSTFLPQACSKHCKDYDDGLTYSSRRSTDDTRLDDLEMRVQILQTRSDSLLVVVILLSVVVMVMAPLIVYRATLKNYFFPMCCSSTYAKKIITSKKKRGSNASSTRRTKRQNNAPTNRPQDSPTGGKSDSASSPDRMGDDTVITNNAVVTMTALTTGQNDSMIGQAGSRQTSPVAVTTPRSRHPSESSCTAEANSVSFCDPSSCGEQSSSGPPGGGYYNYGCSSSSTIAVSPTQSRTSCLSRASDAVPAGTNGQMPLSASALRSHNNLPAKQSTSDGNINTTTASDDVDNRPHNNNNNTNNNSPPRTHRTPSLPHRTRGGGYFNRNSQHKRASAGRARRPSTPESTTDCTTVSNATTETRISCGTLTSDI